MLLRAVVSRRAMQAAEKLGQRELGTDVNPAIRAAFEDEYYHAGETVLRAGFASADPDFSILHRPAQQIRRQSGRFGAKHRLFDNALLTGSETPALHFAHQHVLRHGLVGVGIGLVHDFSEMGEFEIPEHVQRISEVLSLADIATHNADAVAAGINQLQRGIDALE